MSCIHLVEYYWISCRYRSLSVLCSYTFSDSNDAYKKKYMTAPATSTQKPKPKRRYRPGTVALREIRHFQKTWDLVIPAAPFIRLVREISHFFAPEVTQGKLSFNCYSGGCRRFFLHLFEDAMLCAIHAKRVTLMKKILSWPDDLEEKDNLGEDLPQVDNLDLFIDEPLVLELGIDDEFESGCVVCKKLPTQVSYTTACSLQVYTLHESFRNNHLSDWTITWELSQIWVSGAMEV
ncbi:centromeric histone H3 [Datura stramonium]|uniref:Centromeric histone H3 n=1 Tax=Datura stramonium TaxID=4076 RepID=A0ABS8TI04_DATST|nr:centromeric histone H3 [Datura stramonium]